MYVCVGAEADAMPAEIGTTARAGSRGLMESRFNFLQSIPRPGSSFNDVQ